MSHSEIGVSDDFIEECRAIMLHENMDISHLIVHAQQVEESSLKRNNRDAKREGVSAIASLPQPF